MDGVIYHGDRLLPDVKEFVEWLYKENKSFLFLTNSSERSPLEIKHKHERLVLYFYAHDAHGTQDARRPFGGGSYDRR